MRKLEIPAGFNIAQAAQGAINEAQQYREKVRFEFNGITIEVHPQSFVNDICSIYSLNSLLRYHKIIK